MTAGFTPISRLDADPFHVCSVVVAPIFIMCASSKSVIFQRPTLHIANYLVAHGSKFIIGAKIGIVAAAASGVIGAISDPRSLRDFEGYQNGIAIVQ